MMKLLQSTLFFAFLFLLSCTAKQKRVFSVAPPLVDVAVEAAVKKIDPANDQVVKFPSGISIEIKAGAFIDENGQPVTDSVELNLETYASESEIIASGIPMRYVDQGGEQFFESAGMFQLQGMAAGQKIQIDPTKKLAVNFPSPVPGDYDFFFFEENKNSTNSSRQGAWKKMTNEPVEENFDPAKVVGDFKLKFNKGDSPELAALEKITWHLATQSNNPNTAGNNWVLDEEWDEVVVSRPRYGLGGPVVMEKLIDFDDYRSLTNYSKDLEVFLVLVGENLKIYKTNGELVSVIDDVKNVNTLQDGFDTVKNYFFVEKSDGIYLYDFSGSRIGFYGKSYGHKISYKENRVVFVGDEIARGYYVNLHITDLKGKVIKKLQVKKGGYLNHFGKYENNYFLFTNDGYLILNTDDGLSVCDLNGNVKGAKFTWFKSVKYIGGNRILGIADTDEVIIWDFKKNTEILLDPTVLKQLPKGNGEQWYVQDAEKIDGFPVIVLNMIQWFESCTVTWNYETNEKNILDFEKSFYPVDKMLPEITTGWNEADSTLVVFNIPENKELITVPGFKNWRYDGWQQCFAKSEIGKRLLISEGDFVKAFDLEGRLVMDFKSYDKDIFQIGFDDTDKIYALSKNGTMTLWTMDGELLSSVSVPALRNSNGIGYMGRLFLFSDFSPGVDVYNWQGKHIYNYTKDMYVRPLKKGKVSHLYKREQFKLCDTFKLEKHVVQLTLQSSEKYFTTYVYLDESAKKTVDSFEQFRIDQIIAEKKRKKEEAQMIRRFEIAEFGLYNWDRLIKQEGRVRFLANFEFDESTYYNDVSVFLITDLTGPCVVKFDKTNFDKFSIDPKAENKLLAVLPENKVAVFSKEAMKNIDWEKVRQDGEFTFNMKSQEAQVHSVKGLEEVF
ncbi:MAG: hypothetical protein AAFZ15_11705 [Bacteroidota bacterium]